jgi:hypothetical protein
MKKSLSLLLVVLALLTSCKEKTPDDNNNNNGNPDYATLDSTFGFGVLNKVKGIWNGPVTSTTALGGYPEWIVDFRPISENQVSEKSELDTSNNIHMSFFIAKYNNEYRVCFRNGGSWSGQSRVSYFLADSVSETTSQSYYRFAEILIGKNRAYTEVIFRNDSLYMNSYTNKYNTLSTATLHMSWRAKLQDSNACQPAVTNFNFPQKTLTKDFSTTFNGQTEAVYYSITGGDPYPETDQPYLGQATISYTFSPSLTPNPSNKVFLIITTQPLISGISLNTGNLKYRSRYVILAASDNSYTFNYMHPGSYYLYALYDADGNNNFSSGDWVSTSNVTFTLNGLGTTTASTQINFTIP